MKHCPKCGADCFGLGICPACNFKERDYLDLGFKLDGRGHGAMDLF